MKKIGMVGLLTATIFLSGCQQIENWTLDVQEATKGLTGTVQSYDEESNIIDHIYGESVAFSTNNAFVQISENGTKSGSVLDVTVGGKQMVHVGSTLLFYEDGLSNIFDDYARTVDIENLDRATPIVNSMVNTYQNKFTGQDSVILIRSQSGKPLATFAGDDVVVEAMDVEKMTKIMVDGKRIYIYRADYTIYETALLLNNKAK